MSNIFQQPKIIYQLNFKTKNKYIDFFALFFADNSISFSSFEVDSKTILADPDDIWQIEILFDYQPNIKTLKQQFTELVKKNKITEVTDVQLQQAKNCNWILEYQKQLKPIIIGNFIITTKKDEDVKTRELETKTPLYITTSTVFGTGHHETTSLCINALEYLKSQKFDNIIDVGTGSGILSFAAEKIWPNANIIACDIDENAVKAAEINKPANNSNILFYQNKENNLLPAKKIKIPLNNEFNLIISNILEQPLVKLSTEIKKISANNSKIILSGFLESQTTKILNSYGNLGFAKEKILSCNSWVTLILKSIKN
ncbi:MAG: 50S ribosomal protein L11 methyltransferase [Rickettsiaceae bacterium]|nr:50S ribosomal protein L11 methyltransferase [Rickettsiaceae bacterium]